MTRHTRGIVRHRRAMLRAVFVASIALVVALSAIRPVLPRCGGLRTVAGPVPEQGGAEEFVSAFAAMGSGQRVLAEAEQLVLFSRLAQRKFRAVKWAVDLTAAAVGVAGIGLLSVYVTA